MGLDKEILDLIKTLEKSLSKNDPQKPEDEKYYKKYEGAGQIAAQIFEHPKLKADARELIRDIDPDARLWENYLNKYYVVGDYKLVYCSDEFKEKLSKSGFVAHRLYDINHDKMYAKCEHYGHMNLEQFSSVCKRDIYNWFGQLTATYVDEKLVEGKEYTFTLSLPISEDIPTFDEFKEKC